MSDAKRDRVRWIRWSGMGVEFGAAVIGFTLVGYWVGRHYGNDRLGLLIGAGLGIVGGGYNLIREALAATREAAQQDASTDSDDKER